MAGSQEWRVRHPKATLREIEAAVDERLTELRARMLQDVALASQAADVSQTSAPNRPHCPHCGSSVEPRGPPERQVTTLQGKTLRLRRRYVHCLVCQIGFFPWMGRWGCSRGSSHHG
jgi:formate dehydrogenase maturation protein FdhE